MFCHTAVRLSCAWAGTLAKGRAASRARLILLRKITGSPLNPRQPKILTFEARMTDLAHGAELLAFARTNLERLDSLPAAALPQNAEEAYRCQDLLIPKL